MDPVPIVPVILQVIKAFQKVHAGVQSARRCGQKFKDFKSDLQIQEHRFLNECVLLFEVKGEGRKKTQEMVIDLRHDGWKDKTMETQLQGRLKQSYSICSMLVEQIHGDLQLLIEDLQGFGKIESLKTEVSISYHVQTLSKQANATRTRTGKRLCDASVVHSNLPLTGRV